MILERLHTRYFWFQIRTWNFFNKSVKIFLARNIYTKNKFQNLKRSTFHFKALHYLQKENRCSHMDKCVLHSYLN